MDSDASMARWNLPFVLALTVLLAVCALSPVRVSAQTIGGAIIGLAGSGLTLTESYDANGVAGNNTMTFNSGFLGLPNFTFSDGASLSVFTSNPGAKELASDYELSVEMQTVLRYEAERPAVAEFGSRSSSFVGPTVELRRRKAHQRTLHTIAHMFTGMVSIPYKVPTHTREFNVRIVQFDINGRRWITVPGLQKVDESKHVVTVGISDAGKFTVIAEMR